jgi:hypothetical protein
VRPGAATAGADRPRALATGLEGSPASLLEGKRPDYTHTSDARPNTPINNFPVGITVIIVFTIRAVLGV